jgi:hypothetical protein
MSTSKSTPKYQVHGALPAQNPAGRAFELLNKRNISPYKQSTLAEYEKYIKSLTLAQLQDHAVSTGAVIPIDDRARLLGRLLDEYCHYNAKITSGRLGRPAL